MSTAIEFSHVSKQYRLGLVSTKTLSHDIRRFWITNVLGKEDPYLKIGETIRLGPPRHRLQGRARRRRRHHRQERCR